MWARLYTPIQPMEGGEAVPPVTPWRAAPAGRAGRPVY